MNTIKLLLVFLCFVRSAVAAEEGQNRGLVSELELAKELRLYQTLNTLEVPFTQKKTIKDMDVTLPSSGNLAIDRKAKKLIWTVIKPAFLKVTIVDQTVHIESANSSEQTYKLSDASPTEGPRNLSSIVAWLSLDSKMLAKEYSIKKMQASVFEFTPKDPSSSPFQTLQMTLGQNKRLQKAFLTEKSQDTLEINFGTPIIK